MIEVVAEAGGWSAFVPGLPVAADGATRDEAIIELADALREYARDWTDHLSAAPNHRDNAELVRLINRCDDEQLRTQVREISAEPELGERGERARLISRCGDGQPQPRRGGGG